MVDHWGHFGRGQRILERRKEIKHLTTEQRRRSHFKAAGQWNQSGSESLLG
jgi:hypothetical protein